MIRWLRRRSHSKHTSESTFPICYFFAFLIGLLLQLEVCKTSLRSETRANRKKLRQAPNDRSKQFDQNDRTQKIDHMSYFTTTTHSNKRTACPCIYKTVHVSLATIVLWEIARSEIFVLLPSFDLIDCLNLFCIINSGFILSMKRKNADLRVLPEFEIIVSNDLSSVLRRLLQAV